MWLEPITDRTSGDVAYAKQLNNKFRSNGSFDSFTEEEKEKWLSGLKGCLNAIDLNRIEGNTEHLKNLLLSYGYTTNSLGYKTDWTVSDFPYVKELERIRQNVQYLVDGYYIQKKKIPNSSSQPTYVQLNDIEEVLFLLNQMINVMVQNFNRICGTFVSGQSTILP